MRILVSISLLLLLAGCGRGRVHTLMEDGEAVLQKGDRDRGHVR